MCSRNAALASSDIVEFPVIDDAVLDPPAVRVDEVHVGALGVVVAEQPAPIACCVR